MDIVNDDEMGICYHSMGEMKKKVMIKAEDDPF